MSIGIKITSDAIQLVKAKDIIARFIYSCSHRLKSPLTSIEGLAIIAEQCKDRSELNQCLGLIQQCTFNMLDMIKKLEEYTVIQDRQLVLQSIDGESLIKKVIGEFEKQIQESAITVFYDVEQPAEWLSDKEYIHTILRHLVYNSVVYCDKHKRSKKISVKINVGYDETQIEVSDNGIGIANAEKDKIFDPFHRSSNQGNGSGLGLFVVKAIVEKLKAKISVHSAEMIGTSFKITIPTKA